MSAWIPMPPDPWNEIASNLWQGGSWEGVKPTKDKFDAVLTLYKHADPIEEGAGIRHRTWLIPDGDVPDLDQLDDAVHWVWQRWLNGDRVLVRCQAGLNRSGLVVARTLIDHGGNPDEVISLIRSRRSPYALCNVKFEQYLRSL